MNTADGSLVLVSLLNQGALHDLRPPVFDAHRTYGSAVETREPMQLLESLTWRGHAELTHQELAFIARRQVEVRAEEAYRRAMYRVRRPLHPSCKMEAAGHRLKIRRAAEELP